MGKKTCCHPDDEKGITDSRGHVSNQENCYPFLLVYYFSKGTNQGWTLKGVFHDVNNPTSNSPDKNNRTEEATTMIKLLQKM